MSLRPLIPEGRANTATGNGGDRSRPASSGDDEPEKQK